MYPSAASRVAVRGIRWYQRRLSNRFEGVCLYTPSCSVYAIEAIERYGVLRGMLLGARRILRCCAPYHGGFDPVPFQTRPVGAEGTGQHTNILPT